VKPNHALKAARQKNNLSQAELAEKLGSTPINVSRWERGITSPNPYYRRELCELFQIPSEELFPHLTKESESPPPKSGTGDQTVPEDVFLYNHTPLPSPNEFFGRRRERRQILSRVKTGQPVAIVGPRRIGKTWLLYYLQIVVQTEMQGQAIIGYLNAQWLSGETIPQLLAMMLNKLGISEPTGNTERDYLHKLEIGIKELRAKGIVPVLCIDKFEHICKIPGLRFDTLEKLRAIVHIGLCLVTASLRPLGKVIREVFAETDTSPFDNGFMVFKLAPFTAKEAQEFVQKKGTEAKFTDEEQDKVLQYARHKESEQWYPWKLQLVGTLLHSDKMLAQEGYLDSYRPHDSTYWQEFEQRIQEASQEEN
jgi:transcriptional regulator with XRE-family HTH domain